MSEEFKDGDQALPLYKIGSLGTVGGFLDSMLTLHDIKQEVCLPAKILEYDRTTHLATVQSLVQYEMETKDGKKYKDRPKYEEIPVLFVNHGGFLIDFPLDIGDTGLILAIDRSWDDVWEKNRDANLENNEGSQPANDESLGSFRNAVFIPDSWRKMTLADEQKNDLIIRAEDKNEVVNAEMSLKKSGNVIVRANNNGIIRAEASLKNSGDVVFRTNNGENDRNVTLSAEDLGDSDAKFREIIVVTGFKEKVDGKVKLCAKKFRVVADEFVDGEDVEFDAGGGELHQIFLNGTGSTNKFYGTGDIALNITQKTLAAGSNISITTSGNVITISATGGGGGGGTSGYTGTRNVLADVDYSYPYLRKRFIQEVWSNGVMTSQTLLDWQNYHTAVEETY